MKYANDAIVIIAVVIFAFLGSLVLVPVLFQWLRGEPLKDAWVPCGELLQVCDGSNRPCVLM